MMKRIRCWVLLMVGFAAPCVADTLPALDCAAVQTGGFHDYPEGGEHYEPALFHPRPFELDVNPVFMLNFGLTDQHSTNEAAVQKKEQAADLYLTLSIRPDDAEAAGPAELSELECRQVRGADGSMGFSCVNLPPSEMLLINAQTLRFTRTSVGGWTFTGASNEASGDSIYVEYGQCVPKADSSQPSSP